MSRLEEGGIKRSAPHRVNDRKRFATGNRPFEDAPPSRFDYSTRSKNNCGKLRPHDGGNYYDKKKRNYDGK